MADVTSSDFQVLPESAARSHGKAWRRFAARYYDYFLMVLVVNIVLAQFPTIDAIFKGEFFSRTVLMTAVMLLSVPVFASIVEGFGTTPGKWLFGLRVESTLGEKPSYQTAVRREWGVFLEGVACNILPFISGPVAYYKLYRTGSVVWDRPGEAEVTYTPTSFGRVCFGALIVIGLLFPYAVLVTLGVLK